MISEEAAWIRSALIQVSPEWVLDVGSSSEAYRKSEQPHVAEMWNSFRVTHMDCFSAPGVHIVGDAREAVPEAPFIVSASMLEHLRREDHNDSHHHAIARALGNLTQAAQRDLVITAPNVWPHHGSFDNGYRPSLGDLCFELEARSFEVIRARTIHASGRFVGRKIVCVWGRKEGA